MSSSVKQNKNQHDVSDVDWLEVVLGKQGEGIKIIEMLAERRFNSGPLAEEAANYVIENISKDNWQRCAGFKGSANPKTFARKIITNLLEEFSRKRFGRPRPPSWLCQQGEIWVRLWKELCLERQLLPTLIDRYTSQGLYDSSWIQNIATIIKARIPSCGKLNHEATSVEDIVPASDHALAEGLDNPLRHDNPDNLEDKCGYSFELDARAEIVLMLQAIMQENISPAHFEPAAIDNIEAKAQFYKQQLDQLPLKIELNDEEIILLRMVYQEGLSRAATAKALGLSNHQINVKINNALSRLRDTIDSCGLDLKSLLDNT